MNGGMKVIRCIGTIMIELFYDELLVSSDENFLGKRKTERGKAAAAGILSIRLVAFRVGSSSNPPITVAIV